MRRLPLASTLTVFLVLTFLQLCRLNGQDIELDLNISDGEFESTLTIGLAASGSDSFVEGQDIYAPPPAPSGAFDTYFTYRNEAYQKKVLFNGDQQTKQLVLNYAKASGNNPIQISWDTEILSDSQWKFYVQDIFGGSFLEKTPLLDLNGSFVPEEINNALDKQLQLIIEYDPTYTSLSPTEHIPTEVTLAQNYPNPFNPTTQISYTLDKAGQTNLQVFNLQGQKVAELVNQVQTAGSYTITFDATNLPSGIYLYRLTTPKGQLMRKMSVIK